MSFWTAVVIIVAIGTFGGVLQTQFKTKSRKSESYFNDFDRRIMHLEDRMANIETIVLEKEKAKAYERL